MGGFLGRRSESVEERGDNLRDENRQRGGGEYEHHDGRSSHCVGDCVYVILWCDERRDASGYYIPGVDVVLAHSVPDFVLPEVFGVVRGCYC